MATNYVQEGKTLNYTPSGADVASGDFVLLGTIGGIAKTESGFSVATSKGAVQSKTLVMACGGASIPKMGASRLAYKTAEQFGLNVIEPRPGLVPLTFTDALKEPLKTLSGVSVDARVSFAKTRFDEAVLFTHRGLSGPSILQISSYWRQGEPIHINLAPSADIKPALERARKNSPKQSPANFLGGFLPARLAAHIAGQIPKERLADLSGFEMQTLCGLVSDWTVKPAGTEGFRTAEVTLGGVDTDDLSSKTMEAKSAAGLYFIGEAVDVTGHLGGHNFQWAWASGVAAGQNV